MLLGELGWCTLAATTSPHEDGPSEFPSRTERRRRASEAEAKTKTSRGDLKSVGGRARHVAHH